MKKIFNFVIFLLIFCFSAFAQEEITGKDLFEKMKQLDNKEVVIVGECIGDIIKGDKNTFIVNIRTDDNYFIGTVLSKEDAEKINHLGKYEEKGDIIKIIGIFHSNCPVHSGEVDIHCANMEILKEGEVYAEKIDMKRFIVGLVLLFIMLFFTKLSFTKSV
ncbi:MAG TPA: hypothetical protein PLW95_03770 [bacterium]|nr:hypothetical protein [bacterium]